MIKHLILTLIILMLPLNMAFGVTAWVDDNGAAAWGDCQGAAKSGAAACSLATANANASAGDIVNMRTGTYSTNISPSSSGSSGNVITFQNYNSETVTITLEGNGIYIGPTIDYILIDGLRIVGITGVNYFAKVRGDYNTIQNCHMQNTDGAGVYLQGGDYNKILDNTIITRDTMIDTQDSISLADDANYNLIEGNTVSRGGHSNVQIFEAAKNVFRGNTFKQAGDINFSHNQWGSAEVRTLIENNIFIDWGYVGAGDDLHAAPHNVIHRYNDHRATHNVGNHIFGLYNDSSKTVTGNRIYNNTAVSSPGHIFSLEKSSGGSIAINDNRIKNNIFYKSGGGSDYILFQNCAEAGGCNEYAPLADNIFTNNLISEGGTGQDIARFETSNGVTQYYTLSEIETSWASLFSGNIEGNPLFTNEGAYDFILQALSPCIDAGVHLTEVHADDTDSGTSLIVKDAAYFQAGWGVPTVLNDFIAVGTVNNTVEVTAINYATNTLTLANSISRSEDDEVWLYKDSDGTIVLYDTTTDIGAHEYDATPSGALTGTIIAGGVTEAEIVSGGETLIITLSNDTWVATVGADNGITDALMAGIDSGGAEAAGWDAEVKANMVFGDVTREVDDITVTITLGAEASYAITTNETITATIPAIALVESGSPVVAIPTFEITAASDPAAALTGTLSDNATEAQIVNGNETVIITLTNDTWVAAGGVFDGIRQDIIDGMDSAQSEGTGWNAEVRDKEVVTAVVREIDDITVTITLTAAAAYDISANEIITMTVPASALVTSGSPVVGTPTYNIIFSDTSTEEIVGMTLQ